MMKFILVLALVVVAINGFKVNSRRPTTSSLKSTEEVLILSLILVF